MTQRTKIMLIIPHLGGGGAERVTSHLARYLDPQHFEIHLCLVTKDCYPSPPIPRWVQVHRLQRTRVRRAWFQLVRLIHAEHPDVILSGMAHLNFLVLLIKPLLHPRVRILVRQNTTASAAAQSWTTRLLYRLLYPSAHTIICQSHAMASDLTTNFGISRSKLAVLANPIPVVALRAASLSHHPKSLPEHWPRLLAVGRLSQEKGIDILLHALVRIRERHPQAHLKIFGTGPEESALKTLAAELKVEPAVTFCGYSDELTEAYAEASLFVLPSRYEGLPNALLEAAAAGLPIVTTPCSGGVRELLEDAPGTWIADAISSEALSEATLAAIAACPDPAPRFAHNFLAPFEIQTSVAAYAELIQAAVFRGPR